MLRCSVLWLLSPLPRYCCVEGNGCAQYAATAIVLPWVAARRSLLSAIKTPARSSRRSPPAPPRQSTDRDQPNAACFRDQLFGRLRVPERTGGKRRFQLRQILASMIASVASHASSFQ